MLFDLRGRRKRFIQVIYATLAVLMGGGLVLFGIGSDVQGGLFDAFSESGGATSSFSDDADDIEEKLKTRPNDENLLAQLVQTRYSAGNAGIEVDSSGQQSITTEAREEFERATDAWARYERVARPEPNPNIALLAANTAFLLAQTSTTSDEADTNLETAAEAQAIVAKARPSVGTLSTLAQYRYFVLDFEGGDAAAKKAATEAQTKARRKAIERQLAQLRKSAKAYEKQVAAAEKAPGGGGAEALENPLGGLSGGGAAPGATAP
jgi:hypothetical protein